MALKNIFIVLIVCLGLIENVYSQVLGVDETIEHINTIFTELGQTHTTRDSIPANYFYPKCCTSLWSPMLHRKDSRTEIQVGGSTFFPIHYSTTDDYRPEKRIRLERIGNKLRFMIAWGDWSGREYFDFYPSEVEFLYNVQELPIKTIDKHPWGRGSTPPIPFYFKMGNSIGRFAYNGPGVMMYCTLPNLSNCLNSYSAISFQHESMDAFELRRLYNALKYLESLCEQEKQFERPDSKPFSENSFFDKMENTEEFTVGLTSESGVFMVNVNINTLGNYKYIYDTGASSVTVNEDIEKALWKNKAISRSSYIEPALYRIADGSIVEARRFIVPRVTIGNLSVKNLIVSVTKGDLLLGNSAFRDFSSIELDKQSATLNIGK